MSDILLASASRTTDQVVAASAIKGGRHSTAVAVVVDITSLEAGTPSLTVTIRGVDPASGKGIALLQSAALSTVSTTVLRVGQDLTAAANLTANDLVPENIQVLVDHTDSQPITYSVGMLHG
jgi:hypothetical protein